MTHVHVYRHEGRLTMVVQIIPTLVEGWQANTLPEVVRLYHKHCHCKTFTPLLCM